MGTDRLQGLQDSSSSHRHGRGLTMDFGLLLFVEMWGAGRAMCPSEASCHICHLRLLGTTRLPFSLVTVRAFPTTEGAGPL